VAEKHGGSLRKEKDIYTFLISLQAALLDIQSDLVFLSDMKHQEFLIPE